MPNFPPIIIYAIPFFVFAMLLEFVVSSNKNMKSYTAKDAFSSIAMGLGNVFIGFLSKLFVFAALYYVYESFRIFTIPITWWSFVILFFLDDFELFLRSFLLKVHYRRGFVSHVWLYFHFFPVFY